MLTDRAPIGADAAHLEIQTLLAAPKKLNVQDHPGL